MIDSIANSWLNTFICSLHLPAACLLAKLISSPIVLISSVFFKSVASAGVCSNVGGAEDFSFIIMVSCDWASWIGSVNLFVRFCDCFVFGFFFRPLFLLRFRFLTVVSSALLPLLALFQKFYMNMLGFWNIFIYKCRKFILFFICHLQLPDLMQYINVYFFEWKCFPQLIRLNN